MMRERRVDSCKAEEFTALLLSKAGADEESAACMAEVIITADLFGIRTHGLEFLPSYIKDIQSGRLSGRAKPETVKETPVFALVDAHNSIGHRTAVFCMDMAIEKAAKTGIGIVSAKNATHFGFAGFYPLMAVKRKMFGFVTSNTTPCMVPTGAVETRLGSDPIAAGMPAYPYPYLLDISTCIVPGGKIGLCARNGIELDPSWTVGADGRPGKSGRKIFDDMYAGNGGGILPAGGHKGYGLALLSEILTGVMTGGKNSDQLSVHDAADQFSQLFVAMDYGMFRDKDEIEKSLSDYLERIRSAKRLDPNAAVVTHGEPEFKAFEDNIKNGIRLVEETYNRLGEISGAYGVPIEDYLSALS
ncbi:MAG: Ldh family oxidoreductase [Bacillota bacterium]|nr:Ldh family oxidoreductase [Bacillota bacterium]